MSKNIHLTRDGIKFISGSPIGKIIPDFAGQYCITLGDRVFFSRGATADDWFELKSSGGSGGGGGDVDLSDYLTAAEIEALYVTKIEATDFANKVQIQDLEIKINQKASQSSVDELAALVGASTQEIITITTEMKSLLRK